MSRSTKGLALALGVLAFAIVAMWTALLVWPASLGLP